MRATALLAVRQDPRGMRVGFLGELLYSEGTTAEGHRLGDFNSVLPFSVLATKVRPHFGTQCRTTRIAVMGM